MTLSHIESSRAKLAFRPGLACLHTLATVARWLAYLMTVLLATDQSSAFWWEGPKKFTFLPLQSAERFGPTSTGICNATLANFNTKWDSHAPVVKIKAACSFQQDCILNNTSESSKAYMATAQLPLGLAPILLSTASPTITEIALMSLERPLLAGLISIGTAAVSPSRVLGHEDDLARRLLKRRYRVPADLLRKAAQSRYRCVVSALQYVLVAGAVANMLHASWQLGVGSVVTFRCTRSVLPLAWVLALALIHGLTALAFYMHRRRRRGPHGAPGLKKMLRNELEPCFTHEPLPTGTVENNTFVMVFHGISALLGFIHIMFGILIFSSLLFTMILDAAVVIARYFASVLVCRTVLIIELEGLRYVHQQKTTRPLLHTASTFVSLSVKGEKGTSRQASDLEAAHHDNHVATSKKPLPEPRFQFQPPTPFLPRPPPPPPKPASSARPSLDTLSPHARSPSADTLVSHSRSASAVSFSYPCEHHRPRLSLDTRPPPFSDTNTRLPLFPPRPAYAAHGFEPRPSYRSATSSGSSSRSTSYSPSRSPHRGAPR